MIAISILGLIGIFTFGFFISDTFLSKKSHILERVLTGFLLGSGLFTFFMFLANWWLKVPFKLEYSLLILVSLNTLAFVSNIAMRKLRKDKKLFDYNFNFKEGFENLSVIEKVIIVLILLLFLSSLIHNIFWPVIDWDALALYDFRAKSFIATSFMQDAISRGYFTTYPLYTSLLHTFSYLIKFNNPAFIYTVLYMSLVSLFYFIMRKISDNRLLSLFLSLFVSSDPLIFIHSEMAYTNLPYAVFIGVGFAYLIYSFCKKDIDIGHFFLGILIISLGNWVRVLEPFWLISILFIPLLFMYTRKIIYAIMAIFILYLPRFIWAKFLNQSHVIESGLDTGPALAIKGIILNILSFDHPRIISFFYENMLKPYDTLLAIFLITFGLLIYYFFKTKVFELEFKERRFVILLLPSILVFVSVTVLLLGLYLFIFTYGGMAYEIADSALRSTTPFLLLLLFSIFLNIFYIYKILAFEYFRTQR